MFHNTLKLAGLDFRIASRRANNQEAEILRWFQDHKGYSFTPTEVSGHFSEWPITSVRRAISDLTCQGKLRKTSEKRPGDFGVVNYCWEAV